MLLEVIVAVLLTVLMPPVIEEAKEVAKYFVRRDHGWIAWTQQAMKTDLLPVLKDVRKVTTPAYAFFGISIVIYFTIFILQRLTRRLAPSKEASKSKSFLCSHHNETQIAPQKAVVLYEDDEISIIKASHSASTGLEVTTSERNHSLETTVLGVLPKKALVIKILPSEPEAETRGLATTYATSDMSLPYREEGDKCVDKEESCA